MDLSSILALFCGLLTGLFTGLIPGIHVNTVAGIMVALSSSLFQLGGSPAAITIYIAVTAMVHCFFDYIPGLFLGVPNDEVFVLLPGHQMVKEGKGLEALQLSVSGSWGGLLIGAGVLCLFVASSQVLSLNVAGQAEHLLQPFLFWVLLAISVLLIVTDVNRLWAAAVFILSGLYGMVIFASPLVPGGTNTAFSVLFPALVGIFGVSGLILSLLDKETDLPPQTTAQTAHGSYHSATMRGTAAGMAVGLLPGLGGANAATMLLVVEEWLGKRRTSHDTGRQYIVTTSAINTSDTLFGIVALYLIEKTRSGASVAIGQILGDQLTLSMVMETTAYMVVAGYMAKLLINRYGGKLALGIAQLHYKGLTVAVIAFVSLLVLLTTGFWGFVIMIGGVLLGFIAPLAGVRRAQAMGFFLVPVLLFYSGKERDIVSFLRLESHMSAPQPVVLEMLIVYLAIAALAAGVCYWLVSRRLKGFERKQ